MKIVRTIAEHRAQIAAWRHEGLRVCLVTTMGALHDGHVSLITMGRELADKVVATIFVNPTQFGANEDLSTYPRDEERDAAMLSAAGCDMLFAPPVEEVYPPGFATEVRVRGLTDCLCGAARPGHMDGVAQVVAKLLNQAGADYAIFGEKDWQQLALIRRMAKDLDIPTEILGGPTTREPDGLAMSSRNRYLDPEQRRIAAQLNRVLFSAADRIAKGWPVAEECAAAAKTLLKAGFEKVDYFEARDGATLDPVQQHDPANPGRLFAAAHLGKARLIDNVIIAPLS
ncbi:pantoate--beta-alanine ligase [Rhodobacteraceae bacterium NNCM2]|nr:pantoate--beta-alanine ligase [Coraliihabitans acroporae]